MSDDEYSPPEERAQNTINEIMLLSNTGVELAQVPSQAIPAMT